LAENPAYQDFQEIKKKKLNLYLSNLFSLWHHGMVTKVKSGEQEENKQYKSVIFTISPIPQKHREWCNTTRISRGGKMPLYPLPEGQRVAYGNAPSTPVANSGKFPALVQHCQQHD
jgi:hypothetical protein